MTFGALGGAFGLAALPVELPACICVTLHSIEDIAQSEQQDLSRIAVRLSYLEVLALGGSTKKDVLVNSGYWSVRIVLARAISEATAYIAAEGLAEETPAALLRFVAAIAVRFGAIVSEELAAKAIPVIGAGLGAGVNYMLMDHFQDMAHGHFAVLRLEQKHGIETVQFEYDGLRA